MLNDRENILRALREKPLKVYEVMKRANIVNEANMALCSRCNIAFLPSERRNFGLALRTRSVQV